MIVPGAGMSATDGQAAADSCSNQSVDGSREFAASARQTKSPCRIRRTAASDECGGKDPVSQAATCRSIGVKAQARSSTSIEAV